MRKKKRENLSFTAVYEAKSGSGVPLPPFFLLLKLKKKTTTKYRVHIRYTTEGGKFLLPLEEVRRGDWDTSFFSFGMKITANYVRNNAVCAARNMCSVICGR